MKENKTPFHSPYSEDNEICEKKKTIKTLE